MTGDLIRSAEPTRLAHGQPLVNPSKFHPARLRPSCVLSHEWHLICSHLVTLRRIVYLGVGVGAPRRGFYRLRPARLRHGVRIPSIVYGVASIVYVWRLLYFWCIRATAGRLFFVTSTMAGRLFFVSSAMAGRLFFVSSTMAGHLFFVSSTMAVHLFFV